ncbi:MAG: amidohydrolase family protein [Hyphomonadaceae bacterium]|nr:amidohydrolase family protein [Hyphomonadaceae bacterium]
MRLTSALRAILAGLLATACFAFGQAAAQTSAAPTTTIIHAGRLLADPATGRVERERSIIVRGDGTIEAVEAGYVTREGARVIDLKNRFVLPGLIDSHVHLTGELGPSARLDAMTRSASDQAMFAARNATRTLLAGFTTVADVGADDPDSIFALRNAVANNWVQGPRILAAGAIITPHGGHGDINGYRADVMQLLGSPGACSGADDCRRAVRQMVQRGADLIKIVATGGVLSNTAAGVAQQFTLDEMRAIVETAHGLGRRVTAHAHGADGINAALTAGVDSIEHGTYLDATGIRLLKQGNRYLVPTMEAGAYVTEIADRPGVLTPAQAAKARQVGPALVEMVRRARASRVRIAFGTDTGVSPHGDNAREFELLVAAGYTPLEAIQFATVAAADHLQIGNVAGRIAPGYSADIIGVDGDPLASVAALRGGVSFVMARGGVAKGP